MGFGAAVLDELRLVEDQPRPRLFGMRVMVEAATAEQAQDVAQRLVAVVKDRLTL